MNIKNSLAILLLLSLSSSLSAGFFSEMKGKMFGNDISVFLKCVDTLKEKDMSTFKAKQLCTDKYANTIDDADWKKGNGQSSKKGEITFKFSNNSSHVIKKIEYSGQASCKDENICERQYFHGFKYVDIKPNSDKLITLYGQFLIPDGVTHGDWSWGWESITWRGDGNTLNQAFGFKLDY